MNATKRVKIRLETHEIKFVRFNQESVFFCQNCGKDTHHLTVSQMAKLLSLSERKIFCLTESEQIHFTEMFDGKLLICADSAVNFEK